MPKSTATKHPARRFRLADLKQNCGVLESVVSGSGLASEDELAEYRPGGAQNVDRGTWGWVNWKMHLGRFNARAHPVAAGASAGVDHEQEILKALRREPTLIQPVLAGTAGMPNPLAIHPKGIAALLYFHAKNGLLGALAALHQSLAARPTPESVATQLEAVLGEITYQHRLLVWCATHPGPGLPFEPHVDATPKLPEWTDALDAYDLLRVIRAHHEANGGRLRSLKAMITTPPDDRDSPFAWSVFASTVAQDMGVPASVVLRDYTLEELLAQTALSANAHREAMDKAKRDHEAGD